MLKKFFRSGREKDLEEASLYAFTLGQELPREALSEMKRGVNELKKCVDLLNLSGVDPAALSIRGVVEKYGDGEYARVYNRIDEAAVICYRYAGNKPWAHVYTLSYQRCDQLLYRALLKFYILRTYRYRDRSFNIVLRMMMSYYRFADIDSPEKARAFFALVRYNQLRVRHTEQMNDNFELFSEFMDHSSRPANEKAEACDFIVECSKHWKDVLDVVASRHELTDDPDELVEVQFEDLYLRI